MILLDCQTTGTVPGDIIEIAWCLSNQPIKTFLLKVPEISRKTYSLTGITEKDMESAVDSSIAFFELKRDLAIDPVLLIHYARFEKPFLDKLFAQFGETLDFKIICTFDLAKKVVPRLPSKSLRGLSGFFGYTKPESKRAFSHVEATQAIWNGLVQAMGGDSLEIVDQWLKTEVKKEKLVYPLEKSKRLVLPSVPGIYKFLSKKGEILYVGKATSLNSRVNSYFRTSRGGTKREMLTQAWDIETQTCSSILEASLIENDLIKSLRPPYNIMLKNTAKKVVFYSKDFSSAGSTGHYGPFPAFNTIDQVILLSDRVCPEVFFNPIEQQILDEAFAKFSEAHRIRHPLSPRDLFALGYKLWRKGYSSESTEEDKDDIMKKFERLVVRGAKALKRAKLLSRLINAQISWTEKSKKVELCFRNGQFEGEAPLDWPQIYDRMMILNSELEKLKHKKKSIQIRPLT